MQYRVASVQTSQPEKDEARPPSSRSPRQAEEASASDREERQTRRVDFGGPELLGGAAPRAPPSASAGGGGRPSGGGGRLGLAEEAEGPGDAFQLAAKPSGRSILGGGKIGDGTREDADDTEDGDGESAGGAADRRALEQRYAWYYTRLASELEEAMRALKPLSTASTRVELRVWTDARGCISRVKLVRSTGDPSLDAAILSVQGLKLREPPPGDIPMPMIARLTAVRPGDAGAAAR
jgi:outer membrane biosynthesis protein TonB